jgi:hypothetical protein
MAATAWDMVTEKKEQAGSESGHSRTKSQGHSLNRHTSNRSDAPLIPEHKNVLPGAKFGGFGFGRQGEKAAAERGWKISKPMESLPSELIRSPSRAPLMPAGYAT